MRWSLGPAWWLEGRTGVITTLLCLAPITLQLIFAYGLRKGRRAAYFGTLILQLVLGLSTVAATGVALTQGTDENGMARPELVTTASLLLVPVILNAALCVITWWVRRSFTIHAEPSTTSTWCGAGCSSWSAARARSSSLGSSRATPSSPSRPSTPART